MTFFITTVSLSSYVNLINNARDFHLPNLLDTEIGEKIPVHDVCVINESVFWQSFAK